MQPVGTALVGLGYWGPNLLRAFAAQEGCALFMACDLDPQKIDAMRRKYPMVSYTSRFEDVLADPRIELVLIATPTSTHFPLAKAALEHGKHVFVEKPIASTLEEAEELVHLAKTYGKHLFVDHTFVFAPAVQRLASMAAEGAFGEMLYFESERINLGLIQRDTNVLFDLAIHDLSILGTVADLDDITDISAHGHRHFGTQEEDAHLHLTFKSGFHAHIHVSWLSPVKIRRTILGGKRAMALYDDTEPSEKLRIYDSGVDHDTTKPDPFFPKYRAGDILVPALPSYEPLAHEAEHVLRCVRGEETPFASGEDAVRIIRILSTASSLLKQKSVFPTVTWTPSSASPQTSPSEKTSSSATL